MLKAVDGKLPEFVEALVGPGRVDPNYLPPENDLPAVLAAAKKGFPQLNSKNLSYHINYTKVLLLLDRIGNDLQDIATPKRVGGDGRARSKSSHHIRSKKVKTNSRLKNS